MHFHPPGHPVVLVRPPFLVTQQTGSQAADVDIECRRFAGKRRGLAQLAQAGKGLVFSLSAYLKRSGGASLQ
jgi:hypothetical protein